jgi:ABC-type multidrug transport system ATPase subunit
MELVGEPSVLFLDEPTSGLDSSTSLEVCRILRRIVKAQLLTVAAVIHSPSLATFLEFDDILLLGKGGKVIFFGPTDKIETYLELIGFTRSTTHTLPDFIMEVVTGRVHSRLDPKFLPEDLSLYWTLYNERSESWDISPDTFSSEIS